MPINGFEFFKARESAASAFLEEEVRVRPIGSHVYVGMVAFSAEFEKATINTNKYGAIVIRKAELQPVEIELSRAITKDVEFSRAGTYSHYVQYEMALPMPDNNSSPKDVANIICTLLKLRTKSDFLAPIALSHPWQSIPAIKDNSCQPLFLDDYPSARKYTDTRKCTTDDIEWIQDNVDAFSLLMKDDTFRICADAFGCFSHTPNERLSMASLWSGIESPFRAKSEITFKLAAYISSLLEPRGEKRFLLFKKVKKLYDIRSRIVHGDKISAENLRNYIIESRDILSMVLLEIIRIGKVPSSEELDRMLLS